MTKQMRKAIKKEVRDGQSQKYASNVSLAEEAIEKLLSRLPEKSARKTKAQLLSMRKNVETKKTKRLSPHSKRTTPGDVEERDSPPGNQHIEGKRWIKTLTKQTQEKNLLNRRHQPKIAVREQKRKTRVK